jgi:hypothetical protein
MQVEKFGSAVEIRTKITSELLIEALVYWVSISPSNGIPPRSALDPMAIPKLLPTTFLADVEEDGGFRYRLAGSMIEERYQCFPIKGKTPHDVMGDDAENILIPYRRVKDEAVLFYREANLIWLASSHRYTQYKVLLMPFSEDGLRVNMIFGVQEFS